MLSTLHGIYYSGQEIKGNSLCSAKMAGFADFALFVSALVIGIIETFDTHAKLPATVSLFLIAVGFIGILVLACKKIPSHTIVTQGHSGQSTFTSIDTLAHPVYIN